jgi:hypothetical protein
MQNIESPTDGNSSGSPSMGCLLISLIVVIIISAASLYWLGNYLYNP